MLVDLRPWCVKTASAAEVDGLVRPDGIHFSPDYAPWRGGTSTSGCARGWRPGRCQAG